MKSNLHSIDRALRMALAAVALVLFFSGYVSGIFGYVSLAVALIMGTTSFISFCPLYALLGISSKSKSE